MKKLLLVLVAVFCAVSAAFSQGTVTVNVYAFGEGISENSDTWGGGTVQVCVRSVTNLPSMGLGGATYGEATCDGFKESTTSSGTGLRELLGSAGIKYTIEAKADDAAGYYFDKWTTTKSIEGTSISTDVSYTATDSYRSRAYTHNIYAIFMKYRWGYGYPCTVEAVGGGTVSMDGEVSSSKTKLEQSGKTKKKKNEGIISVYYAHETEKVEFVGWYDNEEGSGTPLGTDLELEVTYVPTSTDELSPSAITDKKYYAIFRPKLMGYTQPCEIKISGIGEISVDGTDWKSVDITQQNSPIGYVYQKNTEEKISISYYARITDDTYDFIGWYDEDNQFVDGSLPYIYSYRPVAIVQGDLKCPPTLTAKFVPKNYYYKDFAQAQVLSEGGGETYLGQVYVDRGEYATNIGGITAWNTTVCVGDAESEVVNGYQVTYTYYAKSSDDDYDFKEWVIFKDDKEIVLSDEDVFQYTIDYTNEEWEAGEGNAFTPPVLYARFQVSRNYYHGRATVGVAVNSEPGAVFVGATETDAPEYYTPTEEQPFYTSQEEVVDNDGDGVINNNIIETELNQNKYKYYYYARPSEKAAFKGWTVLPTGDNIISTANPYVSQYTASEEPPTDGPMSLYAVFYSYYHTLPRVVSVGSGKVKIDDQTDFQAEIDNTVAMPSLPDEDNEGNYKNYYSYSYSITAQANEGATFIGWSTSDSEEDIVSRLATYVVNGTTSSTVAETPHRITMYAIFESDIKIKHADRMIYYEEDGAAYINDVNIILEVANAATVKATLTGNTADFELINSTLTAQGDEIIFDATTSIIPLRLMYVGDDSPLSRAVGKQANITFRSYDSEDKELASNGKVVTVEQKPVVTFLPADGKGSYTVSQTDGSGIVYTLDEETDQSVKIDVTHENKSYLQINLTDNKADDGMEFFAWQVIENYGTAEEKISYLSYENIYTHHFTKSVVVRPEFIPEGWARYIVKSNPDVQYFDLNKAIAQARLGVNVDEKMIVVYRNGLLPKGDYTLPTGVTLLVPGEGPGDGFGSVDYLCQINGSLGVNDYLIEKFSEANYKCYRKLTIEDGTQLTVAKGANVCVSARMIIDGQSLLAFPYHYGHIELGNDAVIDVEDGATLYAWGYITNPNDQQVTMHNYKDVGRVVAESGASVWEPLTFTDFRGGTATISFVNLGLLIEAGGGLVGSLADQLKDANFSGYRHNVFPINQYYVQAIEAPLILHSGATENLSTAIHANGATSATPAVLIGKDNGLFRWGTTTATLTKYYDAATDRTKYIVEDTQESNPSIRFGNIGLKLKVLSFDVEVNSTDYVMPITNAMDIYIKSAQVEVANGSNIALMAGSSLYVDKNSKVANNAQIYVYDKDQNVFKEGLTTGYFGSTDVQILPIKSRPYGGLKVTRTVNSIIDASLIVDGEVDCTNGYLITTSSGANITSNGEGKIVVNKFGKPSSGSGISLTRNQSAFQYNQKADGDLGIGYHAIPLAINNNTYYPRLHNSDDSYTEATTAGTYYYCNGTWNTAECDGNGGYQEPFVDYTPRFTLTAPELDGYVGEGDIKQTMVFELQNANLEQADWASVVWDATFTGRDANLFELNKEANPAVTFRPASEGTKTAVMIMTATYTREGVDYVYSQAVDLVATAKLQTANTLAFSDFATLYVDQTNVNLWTGKNNTGDVTITIDGNDGIISEPSADGKFSALKEGTVTVTISQEANNHIAATSITTTITVKPRVVWNWETLYYPSVNTNPITMMDGSTGWTLSYQIVSESGDVVRFSGDGSTIEKPNSTYEAEIYDLIRGKYEAKFIFKQEGYDDIEFTSEIYRDVRRVRLDVNNDTVYNAITVVEPEGVSFDNVTKTVYIESDALKTNAWTIHFIGVPDKMYFVPTGDKPWQIEESANGKTWTTTFTWAYIPESKIFEYSLMPSTQYVRISYAAGGEATLQDIYITKLEGVKFYPEKLYMPAKVGATRNVAITYVSDKNVTIAPSIAGEFSANPSSLDNTIGQPFYNVENVVITNKGCVEQKLTGVNVVSSIGTEILPIQAYTYPQALPIVLASDMPAERFYYVAEHTYNTTWNEATRTITMHNAVAKAQPFVTFHYTGTPTYISFDHNADANGEWIIEESVDGVNWTTCIGAETSAGYIKQTVLGVSKYIRITYNSLHTCKVDITNLMIIGEEGASVDKTEIKVEYVDANTNSEKFTVTAINLKNGMKISTDNPKFTLTHGENGVATAAQSFTLTSDDYQTIFAQGAMEDLDFKVYFDGSKAVDYATITIENRLESGDIGKVLATIKVIGVRKSLTGGTINISTGVPSGYTLNGTFEGKEHRTLDIHDAFAGDVASFDYLFIFGETTTMDGAKIITTPTSIAGSNAKTPCYIYKKNGNGYESYAIIENANASTKVTQDFLRLTGDGAETLKVYITGFCPYASTGYTKQDEGVFFFQGGADDKVHVYLEDCYLYSRSKTENGRFFENRSDGQSFTEFYVRGSGGVLVFECSNDDNQGHPFEVTIHTRGTNMFKSHYGCFLESVAGRAFQVSSPVQVHMKTNDFIEASYTTLSFDDIWPKTDGSGEERTNGFLSLQKQVNNAPSIDLGNANTVVNFNGGQIELQNAQNVSDNYTSTLAISHREGTFAGFRLAYGLGSDGVGGTVNFNDGTTTVMRMSVDERYRQYYLMDDNGTTTSCLRCPQNTYVYGGSHCMMRACSEPTSKGGAPKNGPTGDALGLYQYPAAAVMEGEVVKKKGGWTTNGTMGLVTPTFPPANYAVASVTPNTNGTIDNKADDFLNFWVTSEYDQSVIPEVDQKVSFWKACMTRISAKFAGYGGEVGGDIKIEMEGEKQTELVSNLLYCTIDQNIYDVINGNYSAPVKSPLPSGDRYLSVKPNEIGDSTQHYVLNNNTYRIEDKIYYITTATADLWMTFTAPFDVENIYVVETCNESDLENFASNFTPPTDDEIESSEEEIETNAREATLELQARHNADFAAFFGVAMAIHPNKTFAQIYSDYYEWARTVDIEPGMYELIPYIPGNNSNWRVANCYIYENQKNWSLTGEQVGEGDEAYIEPVYETKWKDLDATFNKEENQMSYTDNRMMTKGKTYSMLLPYCVGCDESLDERDYWDYWSGKFLIFESTDGPHKVNGGEFVGTTVTENIVENDKITYEFAYNQLSSNNLDNSGNVFKPGVTTGEAALIGNSTFAEMKTSDPNVFAYRQDLNTETFTPINPDEEPTVIQPTTAFLLANPADITVNGAAVEVLSISSQGKIKYRSIDDNNDDNNGGDDLGTGDNHVPTINGGSDIFVTSIAEGINIAVAEPQYVGVFAANGTLLFNGWVEKSVNVALMNKGVYVVVGENVSVKVIY